MHIIGNNDMNKSTYSYDLSIPIESHTLLFCYGAHLLHHLFHSLQKTRATTTLKCKHLTKTIV